MLCGEADVPGKGTLLPCAGCDHAAHSGCCLLRGAPSVWFCEKCRHAPCAVCKKPVKQTESIICGPDPEEAAGGKPGCDKTFHVACVGLKRAPKGDWWCSKCK